MDSADSRKSRRCSGYSGDTGGNHDVGSIQISWRGGITLIIAILQLVAAAGVVAGNQLARWFGVAMLGLNAIDMMFFLPAYPFWSVIIIAADIVAVWGLCAVRLRQARERGSRHLTRGAPTGPR